MVPFTPMSLSSRILPNRERLNKGLVNVKSETQEARTGPIITIDFF